MTDPTQPIIVEQAFSVSVEAVWNAITEHQQMIQWFFENIPDFRPERGFETKFNVNTGERDFLHLWKIIEVIPGKKIVFDWRYKDCPGIGKVTFEVISEGTGSRLRVINEGLETFPRDVPEFAPESCMAGWEYLIQGNLKHYLEASQ